MQVELRELRKDVDEIKERLAPLGDYRNTILRLQKRCRRLELGLNSKYRWEQNTQLKIPLRPKMLDRWDETSEESTPWLPPSFRST